VGEQILIAARPFDPTRIAIDVVIQKDVGSIVSKTNANRQASTVVGWTDIEGARSLAKQCGLVRAVAWVDVGGLRGCVPMPHSDPLRASLQRSVRLRERKYRGHRVVDEGQRSRARAKPQQALGSQAATRPDRTVAPCCLRAAHRTRDR